MKSNHPLSQNARTPDYVRNFLGHEGIINIEIYITLEKTMFEPSNGEFIVKVAKQSNDLRRLLEIGFEYICEEDGLVFLRKRK